MQITITGSTPEELHAEALKVVALLGGTSAKATTVLSQTEQAKLRQDAVVVPPKDDKAKAAAEKAAAKAAKAAAEAAAKAAEAEVEEPEAAVDEDDPLADDEPASDEEALTFEDVKKLLVAVREANPTKTTIIKEIVKEHGGAEKLSDVAEKKWPAVAAYARKLLAAKK